MAPGRSRGRACPARDRAGRRRPGHPSARPAIGDPGIGKSRLARDLRATAAARGYLCVEAFCSQDEGAPPLWPWVSLLEGLCRQTGVPMPDLQGDEGSQFALWESIAAAVCAAVAEHPVLLTIDDIHWADPSTLRALRHRLDVTARGRLVIVMTRRAFPAPVDAQAALADALARRHAVRLELTGLDASASAELLRSVTSERRSDAELVRLLERTEGNPFFLIELARAGESVPGSVRDVVARRVGEPPLASRDLLATASVLGRRFRLDALGLAAGIEPARVVEGLLPAMEVGLVLDADGLGSARFSHPLVQDVVVDRIPGIHRAALHASAAQALTSLHDVAASDLARHWRQAGPQHSAQCAETALRAAEQARDVAAYEEELELLGWALEAQAALPDTDDRTLYDLAMARARAARWSGQWEAAEECVASAVALADRLGDHEALARAALSTVEGAVWYSNSFGEVNAFIIDTLERVLQGLPRDDSELRCRVLLSLGIELYFSADAARVSAYIVDAVDMARRLDDPRLLQSVLHGACYGNWRPGSAANRAELAREAVVLAESTGDERALALALAALASALAELGQVEEMWPTVRRGLEVSTKLNLVAATVFLEAMQLPWIALSGDIERARDTLPRLRELASRVAIPNVAAALAHTAMVTGLTDQDDQSDDERVLELAAVPTASAHAVVCVRRGDLETARRIIAAHRERFVADHDDFMSMMRWCYGAEPRSPSTTLPWQPSPTRPSRRSAVGPARLRRSAQTAPSTPTGRWPPLRWAISTERVRSPIRRLDSARRGTLPVPPIIWPHTVAPTASRGSGRGHALG
ncbi:ATP-binding protein [Aeromicrobium sp. UC242_57]|uniref:ATP-binding protein n=1 Tax=Aeromicrobium sp. UC242_57 TaxID=3374624 RepID=UPI00378B4217